MTGSPNVYPDTALSFRRIGAMGMRYVFLLRSSWTRIVELAYWPLMQMIMWGFMTEFLRKSDSQVLQAAGVLIAAVLLWDVMFRSNIGVAVSFLEEMWSRNLAQLFASPLRPYEWALSLLFISLVRTVIGVIPAALLAIPLYHYSIFEMGLPLLAFFTSLMLFGGAVGLMVSGIVLRYGMGAESLAWVGIFLVAPITGIYYPVSVLPDWLQPVAWAPAVDPCVRGHARGAGHGSIPNRSFRQRDAAECDLHGHRAGGLPLYFPHRAREGPAGSDRRIERPVVLTGRAIEIERDRFDVAGVDLGNAGVGQRIPELGVSHRNPHPLQLDRKRNHEIPIGIFGHFSVKPDDALAHMFELVVIDLCAGRRDGVGHAAPPQQADAFRKQGAVAAFREETGAFAKSAMFALHRGPPVSDRLVLGPVGNALEPRRADSCVFGSAQRVVGVGEGAVMREFLVQRFESFENVRTGHSLVNGRKIRQQILDGTDKKAARIAKRRIPDFLTGLTQNPESIRFRRSIRESQYVRNTSASPANRGETFSIRARRLALAVIPRR